MRKFELEDPMRVRKAREALRLIERQHEQQHAAALSMGASMMATPGKATLTGSLAMPALDSASQLAKSMTGAAIDVANLEQANRTGDFNRASWAQAGIRRFLNQLPWLLAAVPRGANAAFTAHVEALVARAEVALDHAPKISQAANDAADRGDYSLLKADLAAWYAKTKAAATDDAAAQGGSRQHPARSNAGVADATTRNNPRPHPVHPNAGATDGATSSRSVQAATPDPTAIPARATTPANPHELGPDVDHDEHEVAARGIAGTGGPLPHLEAIQKSFGHHDVSSIRAHIGGRAAAASDALGAHAYAFGNAIAFAAAPDLHTAAHEAAHVVQQRRGVPRSLRGDDSYERHADRVADRVVRGLPVAALLDATPRGGGASAVVQRKKTSGAPATARSAPELSPKPAADNAPELDRKPGLRWPVFAQTGLPYIIESKGGLPGFWAIRSWVAAESGTKKVTRAMHAPACAREILSAMGWVPSKNLEYAANQLTFTFFEERTYFQVGAIAAHATGLPPGQKAIVDRGIERNKNGLTVTLALDDTATAPGQTHVMTTSEMQRALQAAADFTGIPLDPDGHAFVMTRWRQTLETGSGVLTVQLDRAFCAKLFGPAPYRKWLGDKDHHTQDLETPKLKLENYYKSPIPGRLTHYADVVEHDEEIRLEVVVDWPSHYPNPEIYDAPPMVTPSKSGTVALLQCEWQFKRLDGSSEGPSPKGAVETQSTSLAEAMHRFRLAPGEKTGLFLATCNARFDAYFEPTTIPPRQIVVLSAAEAMSQQQQKAFADLGADNPDRKNDRWTGDVRPGFRASPAAGSPEDIADPSAHDRATQREQLRAVATYLGDKPANAEAVDAIHRELERQNHSEQLLADDRAKGWQSFQIRGTYLSRTEGVPSGPLDLHATAHIAFHQDSYPGDSPSTTQHIRNDKVRVQIRDLSRRFKHVDFEFVGLGDTFDEALEHAFYDLAITYPTGMVSIEAEQIRRGALRRVDGTPGDDAPSGPGTGKVIGFQRSTETTWKTVKQTVWDPVASVGINLGAIALMVFVPGAGAVIGATLIVYNSVPAVDRLKSQADSGTLTLTDIGLSTGEIALNLLPLVSRAKPLTAGWFAVEAANWGGRTALLADSAIEMARELQTTHVAALAQQYQAFLELQKTSLPSDPGLAAAEAAIRQKAAEVDGEIARQFNEQLQANAIQLVVLGAAGSAIHATSVKGRTAILERLAKRKAAKAAIGADELSRTSNDSSAASENAQGTNNSRENARYGSGPTTITNAQSKESGAVVKGWLSQQTPIVQRLLERPISAAARAKLEIRWQKIDETMDRLAANEAMVNSPTFAGTRAEIDQLRQQISTTIYGNGKTNEAEIASRNWKAADTMVRSWASSGEPITVARIADINRTLEDGLSHNGGKPGELRNADVAAGGTIAKAYIAHEDVPVQLASFLEWYRANEATMAPVELAASAYQRLVSIHPFLDANGRTCRMVMDWILQRHGLPVPVFTRGEENVAVFWSDASSPGTGVTPEQATQMVTTAIERTLAKLEQVSSPTDKVHND